MRLTSHKNHLCIRKRPALEWTVSLCFSLAVTVSSSAQSPSPAVPAPRRASANAAVLLETLSWDEAEQILTSDTVVVIALGAESKEHGRHLQLNNDFLMAEYLKRRVLEAAPENVVVAPTVNYSYYPAFLEYPGSTSLGMDTTLRSAPLLHPEHRLLDAQTSRPSRLRSRQGRHCPALHRPH
jgi:Creatinine amidohydrolase